MEKLHEFNPSDRYTYDLGLSGFAQIDTKQDAPYFGTWANPIRLIIFCYCEGDCTTTICNDREEFIAEIESLAKWNIENGYGFNIDPGFHDEDGQPWVDLGLGHFLH